MERCFDVERGRTGDMMAVGGMREMSVVQCGQQVVCGSYNLRRCRLNPKTCGHRIVMRKSEKEEKHSLSGLNLLKGPL